MAQTSYSQALTAAVPGQLGDGGDMDLLSRASNESSAKIPFGAFVAQDTADDAGAKLPAAATAKLLGVAVQRHGASKDLDVASGGYNPGAMMGILHKGRVWVTVEENVTVGDPVFVRFATEGSNTQKGACRKSADNSSALDTAIQAYGCAYLTSATAGNLAQVEVNMPLAMNPTYSTPDTTP